MCMHMADPENAGRDQAGRFAKGRSGNVTGKPKGARNRASLLLDKMAQADAAAVLRAVLDKAKRGDMTAAATILARLGRCRRAAMSLSICRISPLRRM